MKKSLLYSLLFLLDFFSLHAQFPPFSSKGVGGGGALFFPRIHPTNDNEFYVSCDMSQLFHSTDFGKSYDQFHFSTLQANGANSTYEWTKDPKVAYFNQNDGNYGFPSRTKDGGLSWQVLPAHDPNDEGVYRMAANFAKPEQLLVNYYGDIFISNDFGNTYKLVKHTVNNGAGLVMGGVFFDGENIYIGTNEGLLRSTDGGQQFAVMSTSGIPAGQAIWGFAAGKSNGLLRFVCITADVADLYNGVAPWEYWGFAKGVYAMDNASGTWTSRSSGIDFTNDFLMYAGMAWNDANTIYLGGNDQSLGAPLVMKTEDGGQHWAKVFKSANNENIRTGWSGSGGDKNWGWGETCFGITVAPNNKNKVMYGDFGFVHLSKDGGQSWDQAYVNANDAHVAGQATPKKQSYRGIGLENTTCWQIHWHDAQQMLSAFSDIGMIRSQNAGDQWGFTYSGMSVNSVYRILKSPENNMTFAACSGIHDMYQSTRLTDALLDANDGAGKVYVSQNGGSDWSVYKDFGHPVFWLAKDPGKPLLYASVIHYGGGGSSAKGGIWKNDFGPTWTQLPAPPRTEGHPACIVVLNDGKVACTYSGRRNGSGQFTASSGVFLFDPATNQWSDRSDPGMYYWTKDLVLDPSDAAQNTWYAGVFSGWGGAPNGKGGLYRTKDRGLHWSKLTGSQFDRVTSLTFNPLNLKQAFLTTETQGLWVSQNMDADVPDWELVVSYPFRQPERVYFNPYNPKEMWVSSFGNGMRKATWTSPTQEPQKIQVALKFAPNPAADGTTRVIWPTPPKEPLTEFRLRDVYGREVARIALKGSESDLNLSALPPGVYFVEAAGFSGKLVVW